MKTAFKLFALSASLFLFCASEISAQSKSSTSSKASTKQVKGSGKSKSSKPKFSRSSSGPRRLPRYFAHLKLKEEQREEVFQVQAEYKQEINALMNQLAELKEEQQERLEDILTRTQKSLLNKYKAGTLKIGNRTIPKSRGGSKGGSKKGAKPRKTGTRR